MMRSKPLWLATFIYYLVASVPGFCVAIGIACVAIPLISWLFIHQLKWMSFNEWMGYVLLCVPLGILAAGVMAVVAWAEQTDAPIMKKIVLSVLIYALLIGMGLAMVKGIRIILPLSH